MVQLICLIMGFVYLGEANRIKRMIPADFPNVPKEEFLRWQDLELRSIEVFLWVTWSTFFVGMFIAFTLFCFSSHISSSLITAVISQIVLGVIFLVGLFISAIRGSKAAKLKKKLGISLKRMKTASKSTFASGVKKSVPRGYAGEENGR